MKYFKFSDIFASLFVAIIMITVVYLATQESADSGGQEPVAMSDLSQEEVDIIDTVTAEMRAARAQH